MKKMCRICNETFNFVAQDRNTEKDKTSQVRLLGLFKIKYYRIKTRVADS